MLIHESDGHSGGLLLMWKKECKIKVHDITANFIDVAVEDVVEWRLTGFYGEPKWEDKYKSWDYLRDLHGRRDSAWLVLGDFNEILFSWEKDGEVPRALRIRERLDRAVANEAWNELFPFAKVVNEGMTKSDHHPVTIDTEYLAGVHLSGGPAVRRFEARWLEEETEILLKIEVLLEQEEIHWIQRGRANWIRHGDSNTKFFHNFATAPKKKNTIKNLTDEAGVKWEDPDGMSNLIKSYFSGLFHSEVDEPDDDVFQKVKRKLGLNNFIIQSDNLQVVETMLDDGFSATAASAIFLDSRILFSDSFVFGTMIP
ncbi:uncharacterized protein LOC104582375 [Brachypodium distachyon]|uniref:uncharacterized protein LOC104582375 n=1 Tax=Brachypodium distachyon TaxID=15368 RepID=UPI00052FEC1C|nr:uncharacterized protein LOC104582375 [Brachypodium distachyon]|eukprot:XP_010230168.1 uncharacterized protein LOC104582375 [Brachypodium distachyon]